MKKLSLKNMSIKRRLTLYYTAVLVFMALAVCVFILLSAGTQVRSVAKDNLIQAVQNGFDEINYENNVIEIDEKFDSYYRGVTLLVYSDRGERIKGSLPSGFPATTPLENGEFHELQTEDDDWLAYDLFHTYENGNGIWIRGIYTLDTGTASIEAVGLLMLICLPLFAALALIAGHIMSKKAFAPVAEITAAAEKINNGYDLSVRLPLGKNRDELYWLAETLNSMINRLEAAFIQEKEFTSDVSHELKTPVAVILAQCEYALEQGESGGGEKECEAEYREALETVRTQGLRMMSMIQQLMQVSSTINTANSLELEEFDVSMLCESVCDELSALASEKGVSLEADAGDGILYRGDETLIMRMLINLVTNGIKYRNEEAPQQPFVKVELRASEDGRVVIKVKDNGIGISEKDCERIFDRFYKVDKARSDKDSFGLGLSMVKWIAEAHGGSVEVESAIGKGSEFTVTLK